MIGRLKKIVGRNLNNIPGWKTSRRIIVIESDDWGGIRMPSREAFKAIKDYGINVDKCEYSSNDTLASEEDLTALFALLEKHRDKNGNPAVITANTIVANPDFDKIKAADFKEYHYEDFSKTLASYPNHKNALELWKEGIAKKVFHPQLHGREHLNINRWMHHLQKGSEETQFTFEQKMFGIPPSISKEKRGTYMAAFDYDDEAELKAYEQIVQDAQYIFKNYFGYTSKSFIAPNYVWSAKMEPFLKNAGINYLQGSRMQVVPVGEKGEKRFIKHNTGDKNTLGQIYMVRNCGFEPSLALNKDYVKLCMEQVATAFRWRNPAIISSHRLNFIGGINPANRDNNLRQLDRLLASIIKKWPDVEFMTSDQLGDIISKTSK